MAKWKNVGCDNVIKAICVKGVPSILTIPQLHQIMGRSRAGFQQYVMSLEQDQSDYSEISC